MIKENAGISYVIYGKPSGFVDINLINFTNSNGFRIVGANINDFSGSSVASAGDVNGDGYSDVIIGAVYADPNGKISAGTAYVVFGKSGYRSEVYLETLNNTQGFKVLGALSNNQIGSSVCTAGDFNGDGYADVIIGASQVSPYGRTGAGAAYIILNSAGTLSPTPVPTQVPTLPPRTIIDVDLALLNNNQGLTIRGRNAEDQLGTSVAHAGDFNKDGFADIIISAPKASYLGREENGISYLIFGSTAGFNNIDLENLSLVQGFKIIGAASFDNSGHSLNIAGDVNGDGYSDIIIGAPFADSNGKTDAGSAYIIFGKANNFVDIDLANLNNTQGYKILGAAISDWAGFSVNKAGDVNKDGIDDIIIGAPYADPESKTDAGITYIIYGKSNNITNVDLASLSISQGFKVLGDVNDILSGYAVSTAGDFNNDGYSDVIISSVERDTPYLPGGNKAGVVYVILGKNSPTTVYLSSGLCIYGANAYDHIGMSVASAGDINNDGFNDIIIGAPFASPNSKVNAGTTYVIYGKSSISSNIDLMSFGSTQGFKILGPSSYGYSGISIAGNGDINGDKIADIIIGAYAVDLNGKISAGSSYVIYGKSGNFADIDLASLSSLQGFKLLGAASNDNSGYSVNWAGDFNGDGYSDIVIGAKYASHDGKVRAGQAYVVVDTSAIASPTVVTTSNMPSTIVPTIVPTSAPSGVNLVVNSGAEEGNVGWIGFTSAANGWAIYQDIGFACSGTYSFFTTCTSNNCSPINQSLSLIAGSNYKISIFMKVSTDAIVSIKLNDKLVLYTNNVPHICTEFTAIYTAKNATEVLQIYGYGTDAFLSVDDINVALTNETNSPTVFPTRLPTFTPTKLPTLSIPTPIPTLPKRFFADVDLTALNSNQGTIIAGASPNDQAGYSVSSIGDFNGDGFDDIIIGAHKSSPNLKAYAGTAYVIFGSSNGVANIDLLNLNLSKGFKITGTNIEDYSGYSVAGAGDVNGDELDDIIIGAYGADPLSRVDAGTSYIIFGKANSITDIDLANLSATQGFKIFGAKVEDRSGSSVAGIGDFNKDGYDDIAIGAYTADPGDRNAAGITYIIWGRSNGFVDIDLASLTLTQGFKVFGANNGDVSGCSLASAGDINNDSYDDIIIGAYGADPNGKSDAGISYVIFGRASEFIDIDLSSLSSERGFKVLGAASGDNSGTSVSSAGDINKDGYEDIIIGASYADPNSKGNAGVCYIIYGNKTLTTIDLASLNQVQGITIYGGSWDDWTGSSVNNVGDINGDGYSDIVIGSPKARSLVSHGYYFAGKTYVIFGNKTLNNIDLVSLGIEQGFSIAGTASSSTTGYWSGASVSSAGDFNGDGYSDILIGAYGADLYGRTGAGAAFVITDSSGTSYPTSVPTSPSSRPTSFPTSVPSGEPTGAPTGYPTGEPSVIPTYEPTSNPTSVPSREPTGAPTGYPTGEPSAIPTYEPTSNPTGEPTTIPTNIPTGEPTTLPSSKPSGEPTSYPSGEPTSVPSGQPIGEPSTKPSGMPSSKPTSYPSAEPSSAPSEEPTRVPTGQPTGNPTILPTSLPSGKPTNDPSATPSGLPTAMPSSEPSSSPSVDPSSSPTGIPTLEPTTVPTVDPTFNPSSVPSEEPSSYPSSYPSFRPTGNPSHKPTIYPTPLPTLWPTAKPTSKPTIIPSIIPTQAPTKVPTLLPSFIPTIEPTPQPTQNNFGSFPTNDGISVINANSIFKVVLPYMQGISLANNDGFYDINITAPSYATNYVIFGKDGLSDNIDLNNTTHTRGFAVPNAISYDNSGRSVDFIGDYNGDGVQDLVIGNPFAKYGTGHAYVIMGDIDGFNKAKYGFTIFGATYGSQLGWSVASAGDFNGDGFDDIIIGSPSYNRPYPYTRTGSSYLIFGKQSGFSNINVASLTLNQGFTIFGAQASDYLGISVSSAGDINNDGFADIIIGSHSLSTGKIYVILGRSSNFSNIYLANLDLTQGFLIIGADKYDYTGSSVGNCGDINNDGYDDVIVGGKKSSRSGVATSYVIFGKANNFTNIDLATFNKTQGFKISGGGAYVGKAGDVNNDGISDCIVGSGYSEGATSFVIFPATPSHSPTGMPSSAPTTIPSSAPSVPTSKPTSIPTVTPIVYPTSNPTSKPTAPTGSPTSSPTLKETQTPTLLPTGAPTSTPTQMPLYPSSSPTVANTAPTGIPSSAPSNPTKMPTFAPTAPTLEPSKVPTALPTEHPSLKPTAIPTKKPTKLPTAIPVLLPSCEPSKSPTISPTVKPSLAPTTEPTLKPTTTKTPSFKPTLRPTKTPTIEPSFGPSGMPTGSPTNDPNTPYKTITISSGDSYIATSAKEEIIIDISNNIVITSGGGEDKFVIKPHESMQVTITDFNPEKHIIDLQAYSDITKFNQLTITLGSIIINLPNEQKVRLLNLVPTDITEKNFIFTPQEEKDWLMDGLVIGLSSAGIIGAVTMILRMRNDNTKLNKILPEDKIHLVEQGQGVNIPIKTNQVLPIEKMADDEPSGSLSDTPAQLHLGKQVQKVNIPIKTNQVLPIEKMADDEPSGSLSDTPSNSYENSKYNNQVSKQEYNNEVDVEEELSSQLPRIESGNIEINADMSPIESPVHQEYEDSDLSIDDTSPKTDYPEFNSLYSLGAKDDRLSNSMRSPNIKISIKKVPSVSLRIDLIKYEKQDNILYKVEDDVSAVGLVEYRENNDIIDDNNNIAASDNSFDIENSSQKRNPLEMSDQSSKFFRASSYKVQKDKATVLLSIDASMDTGNAILQYREFIELIKNLKLFVVNDMFKLLDNIVPESQSPEAINNFPTNNVQFDFTNELTSTLLNLRQLIVHLPMLKCFGQRALDITGTNITLSDSLSNKDALIEMHLGIGHIVASLCTGNVANVLFISTINTYSYTVQLHAFAYLHAQKLAVIPQDQPMNIAQLTDYCGFTMLAYTVPSIAHCAIIKLTHPEAECGLTTSLSFSASMGGAECYNVYKVMYKQASIPTTADLVIPYIADSISLILASKNLNLGFSDCHQLVSSIMQSMKVLSIVVATDFLSRTVMDIIPRDIKQEYFEPVFVRAQESYEYCEDIFEQTIGTIKEWCD